MDDDGDFSAFASARWGSLVRSAVFLGCSLDEAHDLVQTTLLRCYTAWRKGASIEFRSTTSNTCRLSYTAPESSTFHWYRRRASLTFLPDALRHGWRRGVRPRRRQTFVRGSSGAAGGCEVGARP